MQFKYPYTHFSFLPFFLAVTVQAVAVLGSVIGTGRLPEITGDYSRLLQIAVLLILLGLHIFSLPYSRINWLSY
jgi:hypothetical protein